MPHSHHIYVSLGSNIDPHKYLAFGLRAIEPLLHHCEISPVYESPAVGMSGPNFLNAVIGGETDVSHYQVVQMLKQIEHDSGRNRTENKFVNRTLDLDLLLYGNLVCEPSKNDSNPITLPHPEIIDQAYVLKPLADIAGHLIHPTRNRKLTELLTELQQQAPEKFANLKKVTLQTSS